MIDPLELSRQLAALAAARGLAAVGILSFVEDLAADRQLSFGHLVDLINSERAKADAYLFAAGVSPSVEVDAKKVLADGIADPRERSLLTNCIAAAEECGEYLNTIRFDDLVNAARRASNCRNHWLYELSEQRNPLLSWKEIQARLRDASEPSWEKDLTIEGIILAVTRYAKANGLTRTPRRRFGNGQQNDN